MGAPPANTNAATHYALTLGSLPAGLRYVARLTTAFQRALEAAVKATHGDEEISYSQALLINSAARNERGALLIQRWLREASEKMTPTERMNFLREISVYTDRRDKCVKALKLDAGRGTGDSTNDPWAQAMAEIHGDADDGDAPDDTSQEGLF